MSWSSYIPTITTGVVGVVGILVTSRQARREREAQAVNLKTTLEANAESLKAGITAEDARARLAEKRRVYANCLSTLTLGFAAIARVKARTDKSSADYGAAVREAIQARAVATSALHEVRLIAPEEIDNLATTALRSLLGLFDADDSSEFGSVQRALTKAMRADLSGG